MATSYFVDSCEAPREFHISSIDSDSRYTKCLLCYNIKRHFYCVDCIKSGNFVHSASSFSDRFADKQLKLYRIKSNRKHIKDRCETLLLAKSRKDKLHTEISQYKDKVELLNLAIEQTQRRVDERKKEQNALLQYNGELKAKLPRYGNRVVRLGKHAAAQNGSLQATEVEVAESARRLAALRRARIRQLIRFIFPVQMSYNTRESVDFQLDDTFFHGSSGLDDSSDSLNNSRLQIVAPWLPANGDYSEYTQWVSLNKDAASGCPTEGAANPVYRISAALSHAAQLISLLAFYLDVRLPFTLNFMDYSSGELSGARVGGRVRRLCACCAALAAAAERAPPPVPRRALLLLDSLATAAAIDDPGLGRLFYSLSHRFRWSGWMEVWITIRQDFVSFLVNMWPIRVEQWISPDVLAAADLWVAEWLADGGAGDLSDDEEPEPPEHLHWADWDNMDEAVAPQPTPAQTTAIGASIMTSAAASLASIWRGWTK